MPLLHKSCMMILPNIETGANKPSGSKTLIMMRKTMR